MPDHHLSVYWFWPKFQLRSQKNSILMRSALTWTAQKICRRSVFIFAQMQICFFHSLLDEANEKRCKVGNHCELSNFRFINAHMYTRDVFIILNWTRKRFGRSSWVANNNQSAHRQPHEWRRNWVIVHCVRLNEVSLIQIRRDSPTKHRWVEITRIHSTNEYDSSPTTLWNGQACECCWCIIWMPIQFHVALSCRQDESHVVQQRHFLLKWCPACMQRTARIYAVGSPETSPESKFKFIQRTSDVFFLSSSSFIVAVAAAADLLALWLLLLLLLVMGYSEPMLDMLTVMVCYGTSDIHIELMSHI